MWKSFVFFAVILFFVCGGALLYAESEAKKPLVAVMVSDDHYDADKLLPPLVERLGEENGWDVGQDDEELFELAMHDRQYRDYKSGLAKQRFEEEVKKAKAEKAAAAAPVVLSKEEQEAKVLAYISEKYPHAQPIVAPVSGTMLWEVDYTDKSMPPAPNKICKEGEIIAHIAAYYGMEEVLCANSGKLIDTCTKQGAMVKKGEVLGWIE